MRTNHSSPGKRVVRKPALKNSGLQRRAAAILFAAATLFPVSAAQSPLWLNVELNGEATGDFLRFELSDEGVLSAPAFNFERWGVSTAGKPSRRIDDEVWHNLADFPQLQFVIDQDQQHLTIDEKAWQPTPPSRTIASHTIVSKASNSAIASSDASAEKTNPQSVSCTGENKAALRETQTRYTSKLLAVFINGIDLKDVVQVIQRPCGTTLAPVLSLRNYRMDTSQQPNVLIDGEYWLSLDAYTGVSYRIDESLQQLELQVDPLLFAPIEIDFDTEFQPAQKSATGAFLNYALAAARSDGSETSYSGSLELGLFAPIGSLTSQSAVSRLNGEFDHIRLSTLFTSDFPDKAQTLRIGDISARGGAWGRGYQLGGIQFGSNFGIQPTARFTPVESIRVVNERPAFVRLLNRQIDPLASEPNAQGVFYNQQQPLAFGPIDAINLPTFSNGIYTLQQVDPRTGEATQASQSYYFNEGLLRQGTHSYSVELGLLRQGGFSDKYDEAIFSATERYGFNRRFTGEVHVEYGDQAVAYGLSGSTSIPWAGVLTTTVAAGHPEQGSWRQRSFQAASLTNRYRRLSYNVNYRRFDKHFIHPGEDVNSVNNLRHSYAAGVSTRLPWRDSISLGYSASSQRTAGFRDTFTVGYTLNVLGAATANLFFTQPLHPDDDWLALANMSFSFDVLRRGLGLRSERRSSRGQLFSADGSNASISLSKPENDSLSGSLRLSTNASQDLTSYGFGVRTPLFSSGPTSIDGNYSTRYFNSSATVTRFNGQQSYGAGISGGIAALGGGLYFARPLTNSFGLVRLGEDASGIRVNGVRTNKRGNVLIPNLQAYFDNRVAVSVQDLPLNAQLEAIEQTVRPRFRSGVIIDQEIPYVTDALVSIALNDGSGGTVPLPLRAEVLLDDQSEPFPVGDEGLVYLTGVRPDSQVAILYKGKRCRIAIQLPERSKDPLLLDEIPELGPLICAGVSP